MESSIYTKEIKIQSYEVDQNNQLRLSCLMQYFQQIARENLDVFGLTYEYLRSKDIVFVLSRYTIKLYKPMLADRSYLFKTSPSDIHGPYFIRDFTVTDSAGEVMAESSTAWVIIQYSNRRLLRPSALPKEIPVGGRLVDFSAERTDVREDATFRYSVHVVNSMLDCNNHLNNCHYADILLDGLYENKSKVTYSVFHLNYVHEAHFGDDLEVLYTVEEDVCYVRVLNVTQNNVCFTAVLK